MNAITKIIQKVRIHHLKFAFTLIVFFKLIFLLFVLDGTLQIYPTPTDAYTYDLFALGLSRDAYSIWSYILKELNDLALYNRTVLTIVLFTTSTLVTPFVYASLIPHAKRFASIEIYYRTYWCVAIYICVYPTLNLYSLDIFRDAVMVLLIGITFMAMKIYDSQIGIAKFAWLLTMLGLCFLVYQFRNYLAVALIVAFLLRELHVYRVNKIVLFVLYMGGLLIIRSFGWLDPLLNYRALFEAVGGSSLNLSLKIDDPLQFVMNYVLSVVYQFFGLHINSIVLLVLFLTESTVVIISGIYSYRHKHFITKTEEYIILFAIVYAAIWTFFNDNMGTAIRLRMYDYLAILIVAASLLMRQTNANTEVKV
ncbi:MAG TPA: hypothetical protein PKC80_09040 [Burkholderiaceae bacterium]|nr:hypothetical protein [Burkholderiaceae bacterium]